MPLFSMPMLVALIVLLLALPLRATAAEVQQLKVIRGAHPLDHYCVLLLETLFREQSMPYQVKVLQMELHQSSSLSQLKRKVTDVYWAPTSPLLEKEFNPIYFPLFKGLLGYRLLMIAEGTQEKFSNVTNLKDARAFVFAQVNSWADTQILKANGFKVATTTGYEALFPMLNAQQVDAVPRGVFEPWAEIAARPQYKLDVESTLVIKYIMPFYLFVRRDNPQLAHDLQIALDAWLESGRYDAFLFEHELIKENLDKALLSQRRILELRNPYLTDKTPLNKKAYWYDPFAAPTGIEVKNRDAK
jgi:hypothetical protein